MREPELTPAHSGEAGASPAIGMVDLLVFAVDSGRYGVRAAHVLEAARAVAVAAIPDAPAVIEGVINYRGRIIPVIDVRRRLGLPSRPLDASQHFVIVEAGPRSVALRVDRAVELVTVAADAIESAERAAPGSAHTEGVARLPDGLIVIHDLARFLSLDEGRELDAAVMADRDADAGDPE